MGIGSSDSASWARRGGGGGEPSWVDVWRVERNGEGGREGEMTRRVEDFSFFVESGGEGGEVGKGLESYSEEIRMLSYRTGSVVSEYYLETK
uniref:Uncharacterized protein n=1 Tax=Oryza rufipogon TaxID=4529 RepID=A0A0E0R894_ORYRU